MELTIVYSLRFDAAEMDLWARFHTFLLHHQVCEPLCFELVQLLHCLSIMGKVRQVLFENHENNAVMKRKASNCVGILSDQGKLQLLQTSVNILH